MSVKSPNPFPGEAWSIEAFQNASYVLVTMGFQVDQKTGLAISVPHTRRGGEPIQGSPGEVLSNDELIRCVGHISTKTELLDFGYMMGWLQSDFSRQISEQGLEDSING